MNIQLCNGSYYHFLEPDMAEVDIYTIAHALSLICRFSGHVSEFYSVAEHSVLVSLLVPAEDALDGLLHDATEALLGDVSAPLKRLLPEYRRLEAMAHRALAQKFGVREVLPDSVKHADMVMLATERRDLMPHTTEEWECLRGIEPAPLTIRPLSPQTAGRRFLARFMELTARRGASAPD